MAFVKGETYPSSGGISQQDRERILGHRGCVVWLTGLSASGKTTIAQALESVLLDKGIPAFVLDGDSVRRGLCKDLGFSETDRHENIRRVGEVAALMAQAGVVAIAAFISPFQADRDAARSTAGHGRFVEVFLNTSLAICEGRDPKDLYKRARAGQIPFFTGISSPYEPPETCEVTLNTAEVTVEECVAVIDAYLRQVGIF